MARPRFVTDGEALGIEAARRLATYAVCDIEPGLSDAEFDRVEREFGFTFADDHRAFLATGLPVNSGMPPPPPRVISMYQRPWPDWRHDSPETLRHFLGWPAEGLLFDVEHNRQWHPSWGPRPDDRVAAIEVAKSRLSEVPTMVPIYGHRYLPAGRGSWGHSVLSMWQTDIVCYGHDLADYIDQEFGPRTTAPTAVATEATVDFWRDYL